jgi:hypothetical protein
MKTVHNQCAELLSAAFLLPDFLILKNETEWRFPASIYERIFTNWFATDEGSSTNYDVDSLVSVQGFLSALAIGLNTNLYNLEERSSVGPLSSHIQRIQNLRVHHHHREVFGRWLEMTSIATLISLASGDRQFRTDHPTRIELTNDVDAKAAATWRFIWTDVQGEDFRQIHSQTIGENISDQQK